MRASGAGFVSLVKSYQATDESAMKIGDHTATTRTSLLRSRGGARQSLAAVRSQAEPGNETHENHRGRIFQSQRLFRVYSLFLPIVNGLPYFSRFVH